MNELARANEELENVATQLYETGQTLDESNAEVGGAHCMCQQRGVVNYFC